MTNRFGKRLYEIFFKTYTEKVWGIPCTEIRAEWAAQRIQGLSLAKAILTATALNKRSTDDQDPDPRVPYPRLGPGQMWETCRDRIVEMGNDVLMQHRVTAVEMHATGASWRAGRDARRRACRFRRRPRHLDDAGALAGAARSTRRRRRACARPPRACATATSSSSR